MSNLQYRIPGALLSPPSSTAWLTGLASLGIATLLGWFSFSVTSSPLRKYPGPFLARWTNLWRLWLVRTGDYHLHIKKLHDQLGPIVRIGPNTLDLDLPELIKIIYGTDGKWLKTEFYHNNSAVINGKITYHMFSETRSFEHALLKRPVVRYFSPGSTLAMEPLMDVIISSFCDHLETRFINDPQNVECDFGAWIGYCAWDINSAITFSQPFGYMDAGYDHDGTLKVVDQAFDYFSVVGQIPFLDYLFDKNPVVRLGPPNLESLTRIALTRLSTRLQGTDEHFNPEVPDFLQHYIHTKESHPEVVDNTTVVGYLLLNLQAGADTSAITIRAVFYFLLRHPNTYDRLKKELRRAGLGTLPSYKAARPLEYLEAVIRESMRLHPVVIMPLERYVPESGLKLGASFVPPGTAVGINPYVAGRNTSVWGADAEKFRPERWLRGEAPGPLNETEEAHRERLRVFNLGDLRFGAGSRICIGRHVAEVMVYKIVATLVNRYEIELVDKNREWVVLGRWLARQKGLLCRLKMANEVVSTTVS